MHGVCGVVRGRAVAVPVTVVVEEAAEEGLVVARAGGAEGLWLEVVRALGLGRVDARSQEAGGFLGSGGGGGAGPDRVAVPAFEVFEGFGGCVVGGLDGPEMVFAVQVAALAVEVGADRDGGPSVLGVLADDQAAGSDVVEDLLRLC